MKLVIGADICPTKSNQAYFINNQMDKILSKDILDIIYTADYRIFNLETPLLDNPTNPIKKNGPHLVNPTSVINGIKELNIDFFTLANNHILDYGPDGLYSTINTLKANNIKYAGVGDNINSLIKSYIIENKNEKIGIYCCAEHEFSIATKNSAGANPFDPLESLDEIYELKAKCDYVICLFHGGKENYRYPTPNLQKICRKMVEKGANLVICQHTHCVGCEEKYLNGTIVYGQGNFIFDNQDNEYWNSSILILVDTAKQKIDYLPLCQNEHFISIEISKSTIENFDKRNEYIKDAINIEKEFVKYIESNFHNYILCFYPKRKNLLFRILNKMTKYKFSKYIAKKILKKNKYAMINMLECETHLEILKDSIKKQ